MVLADASAAPPDGQELVPLQPALPEKPIGERAQEVGSSAASDRVEEWDVWELFTIPGMPGVSSVEPSVGVMERADVAIGFADVRLVVLLSLDDQIADTEVSTMYALVMVASQALLVSCGV